MGANHLTPAERQAILVLMDEAEAHPTYGGSKAAEMAFRIERTTPEALQKSTPDPRHILVLEDGHTIIFTHDEQKDGTRVWHFSMSHLTGRRVARDLAATVLRAFGYVAMSDYDVYEGERAIHVEGRL
jgi:hypothetical protein